MIHTALPDIDAYIAAFGREPLPVLRRTARALEELRVIEDQVNGRQLAAVVLQDPLLTLRVLTYLESHRPRTQNHDITTIDRALMMLGISPFFARFVDLPTVEDRLEAHPRALIGVLGVITRARRASGWARDWAMLRHDIDVDEVTVAALLHDAAEVLCWCFAPALMLEIRARQQAQPGLRSATAQQAVLGCSIHDLQLALIKAWHLPELLITLMDDAFAHNPRVRNVALATNLARHSANGWNDAALPDDFAAIGELLHMGQEQLLHRLGVDATAPAPPAAPLAIDSPDFVLPPGQDKA